MSQGSSGGESSRNLLVCVCGRQKQTQKMVQEKSDFSLGAVILMIILLIGAAMRGQLALILLCVLVLLITITSALRGLKGHGLYCAMRWSVIFFVSLFGGF